MVVGAGAFKLTGGEGAGNHGSHAVDLVQAVLQVERLTCEVGEINDDVHPLGHANAHAVDLDGIRQEISVIGNHKERVGRGIGRLDVSGEEELKEA